MRKNHNRLYYGKYRYKTVFKMPGSLIFYPTTNEHLLHIKRIHPDLPDINFLADFIIKNRKRMKFRFQDKRSMFYTDRSLAQTLIGKFWDYWIGSENVDPKFNNLGKDVVGCSRLPHGKYQYQVHLKKDAQVLMNDTQIDSLWEFLERNVDNCLVTNYNIIDFLEKKSPYCYGGYFYVRDEKYLSPIYMMAQQAIDKVIQFRKVQNGGNKKIKR
tara:strand:- start:926 stop:1567 length:642 start_codon:yes stop_codon:yes gene_type:complete